MNRDKAIRSMTRNAISLVAFLTVLSLSAIRADEKDAAIKPFKIAIGDDQLKDLKDRLAHTRFPDQLDNAGWDYGVELGYVKKVVDYWRDKYDWRAEEKKLNELPQFTTEIDGLSIHFVHVRSKEKNALPLVLVHGWPGSFCEFQKVVGPLTDPVKHGGKAEQAFHVVIPSLPGFGFSSKPKERGWNSRRMAEVIAKLMARLGYDRYGAQGGDWGAGIVRWLAANDGDHCIGSHSNFPPGGRPKDDSANGVTDEELKRYEKRAQELNDHKAYGAIQGTRPLTLGYALNDSPAGLAAWVIDKFWAWSDHGGDLEKKFTRDELLTNVMIYWVTETMPSAMRIYYESSHPSPRPKTMTPWTNGRKSAPMGYVLFPKEINVPPRAWVERATGRSMIHWTEMPRGGHFAAMEEPALLVEDVRKFFGKVR